MVKYVKFKKGTGTVYKISEKEYKDLKDRFQTLIVVKSVTRKRKNNNPFGLF